MNGSATVDRPTDAYHARWDAGFADRLVNDLLEHFGEWRDLGSLYCPGMPSFERCTAVRDAIEPARRVGLVIEGDKRLGYRLTGFTRQRYVRPAKVLDTDTQRPLLYEEE